MMNTSNRSTDLVIDGMVQAWMSLPDLEPLCRVVMRNRRELGNRIAAIYGAKGKKQAEKADEARREILRYAMAGVDVGLNFSHFVLFKEYETVQVILEDAFDVVEAGEMERIVFPWSREVVGMIARCLFRKRGDEPDMVEIASFMKLLAGGGTVERADQDRSIRYRTMLWLAYLLIALVTTDSDAFCGKESGILRNSLISLLELCEAGRIIDEESSRNDFAGGKWSGTLFGWLQGEDRKPFLLKLRKLFNFDNRRDHGNRLLLAHHRDCMIRQALSVFCPGDPDGSEAAS